MSFCDRFKKYVLANEYTEYRVSEYKHVFFKRDSWYDEVKKTEEVLGIIIPVELKEIYKELGYGFLCALDKACVDRIMPPIDVSDFYLKQDVYEYNEVVDCYALNEGRMVFFEVDSDLFLTVSLTPNKRKYPVYLNDKLIAKSLQEFLERMDEKTDYYFDYIAKDV